MALKSKSKFHNSMRETGVDYHVNFEAYGKVVKGYVYPYGKTTLEELNDAIDFFDDGSYKKKYDSKNGRVIIQVSYFKAYGWNH